MFRVITLVAALFTSFMGLGQIPAPFEIIEPVMVSGNNSVNSQSQTINPSILAQANTAGYQTNAVQNTYYSETFGNGFAGDPGNGAWITYYTDGMNLVYTNPAVAWEYRGLATNPTLFHPSRGPYSDSISPYVTPSLFNGYMVFDAEYQLNGDSIGGNPNLGSSPFVIAVLESPIITIDPLPQTYYLNFSSQIVSTWGDFYVDIVYNGNTTHTIHIGSYLTKPRKWNYSGTINLPLPKSPGGTPVSTVQIKFRHLNQSGSSARGGNFLTIDDVSITSAPDRDFSIDAVNVNPDFSSINFPETFWPLNPGVSSYNYHERWFNSHYEKVPVNHAASATVDRITALVHNRGQLVSGANILVNLSTDNSPFSTIHVQSFSTIASGQYDTLNIVGNNSYELLIPPPTLAKYRLELQINPSGGSEGFPANNSTDRNQWSQLEMEVTDSTFAWNSLDSIDYQSGFYGISYAVFKPIDLVSSDTITSIAFNIRGKKGAVIYAVLGLPANFSEFNPQSDNLIGMYKLDSDTSGLIKMNVLNSILPAGRSTISLIAQGKPSLNSPYGQDSIYIAFGSSTTDKVNSYEYGSLGLNQSQYLSTFNPAIEYNFGNSPCVESMTDAYINTCYSHTMLNGTVITESGVYYDTIVLQGGCATVIQKFVTIQSQHISSTVSACTSYLWSVSGQTLTATGTYYDSVMNQNGCMDYYTLNLNITHPPQTIFQTSCVPYTWSATGLTYQYSGSYQANIPASNGCDSILLLNLTIANTAPYNQQVVSCGGYVDPLGQTLLQSGNYTYSLTDAQGCDSVINLDLTITPPDTTHLQIQSCGSYLANNGQTYSQSGVYFWNQTDAQGCDSVSALSLTVNAPDTTHVQTQSCVPITTPAGQLASQTGTYYWLDTNIYGCDSVTELNFILNSGQSYVVDTFACGPIIAPNGVLLTLSGSYNYQMVDVNGCDSNVVFNYSRGESTGFTTATGCDQVTVNGLNYIADGTYQQTLTNIAGCDSILTVSVDVQSSTNALLQVFACQNYTAPTGQILTQSGLYNYTLSNSAGCDSLVTIDLNIQSSSSQLQVNSCGSYTLNGVTYVNSGTYTQTLLNSAGCDSTITLNLTLQQPTYGSISATACNSYIGPTGVSYTQSGSYNLLLTNAAGCDSVVTLNLTINSSDQTVLNPTTCTNYTAPDGSTLTQSGVYNYLLQNTEGCDSLVIVNLTVLQPTQSSSVVNTCDGFYLAPNGITYTQSGLYNILLTNSVGCDSVISLQLNLLQNSSSAISVSSCGDYMAPDGTVYNQSGSYTSIIPNHVGCDSIIYIGLTIEGGNIINQQPADQNAYIQQSAQFSVVATGTGLQYQWETDLGFGFLALNNAGQFSGVNTSQLTVQNLNMTNDNQLFRCRVQQNNCADTSTVATLQVIDNTSTSDHILSSIQLFPNPAKRVVNLNIAFSGSCELLNAQGQIIMKWDLNNQDRMDLPALSQGLYTMVFYTDEGRKALPLSIRD